MKKNTLILAGLATLLVAAAGFYMFFPTSPIGKQPDGSIYDPIPDGIPSLPIKQPMGTPEAVVTNFEECIVAGNPVMESFPRQCRHKEKTYVEEIRGKIGADTGPILSEEEALRIAGSTQDCTMAGIPGNTALYNPTSKTWWIDLQRMPGLEKDGCNPACVVQEENKTAEVNWRCTGAIPTSADNAPPGSIHNLPVPDAVAAVRTAVAKKLNIDEGVVIIMTAFEKEWSDSCLGLGGPAESCLFAITPGFEVVAQGAGKEFKYRTNADGTELREEIGVR